MLGNKGFELAFERLEKYGLVPIVDFQLKNNFNNSWSRLTN